MRREEGFTLIELLVVILIIGILAAISLGALLQQEKKGRAADAKTGAAVALRTIEHYGVEHDGYAGVTNASLGDLEPSLNAADDDGRLLLTGTTAGSPTKTTFVVGVRAKNDGAWFAFYHDGSSPTRRLCSPGGAAGCSAAIPGLSFPGYGSVGTW